MRPIDADALYYKVKCECNPYGKPTIDFESGKKVLDWIEKAPTVERPHGEWIFDKDYPMIGSPYGSYKCSECGMHTDDDVDRYCWFCGARMKGGEENEQT